MWTFKNLLEQKVAWPSEAWKACQNIITISDKVTLLDEAGRMISAANMKTLKAAIETLQNALQQIGTLTEDDDIKESIRIDQELDPLVALAKRNPLAEAAKILAQCDSYDAKRTAVHMALRRRAISDNIAAKVGMGTELGYDDYYDYGSMPHIRDMYDDAVVYSLNGTLYQCDYTYKDDVVSLGDSTKVEISYVPTSESKSFIQPKEVDIRGDIIKLEEKAVNSDGRARVKLISPGWGSSGYYSAEMLKKDGPKVFNKGLHMYMNHPTEEEDRNRPERDVRDLAGVVDSNVVWENASSTNTGDGLYADVKVFPTYSEFIDAAAPHIGVSIRAAGTAIEGEAEGRHGLLVDSLTEGYSVDYVTVAGRGGEVLPLYESARNKVDVQTITEVKKTLDLVEVSTNSILETDVDPEELKKLQEAASKVTELETKLNAVIERNSALETQNTRLSEAMLISQATNVIANTLSTIQMPNIVRESLSTRCLNGVLPRKEDGSLDSSALTESVKEAAKTELVYIESIVSNSGGKVTGMSSDEPTVELDEAKVDEKLTNSWTAFGLSESGAKLATIGRSN